MAAVLIAVALYVVENYGGNGFVPSWDQIYQWVGLEPSQSETTAPLPEGETEVVFLDVGQGDAVLILQNGAACLIDAGTKDARQNLVQDLRSYGVSQLDLLVMTHPHADHVGGMQAVLQNFDVQTLLTPDLSETDVTGQTLLDTGDDERNEEAALAEQYPFRLRSTVFKAGHHGSSTSNTQTLLWQVQPQLVVASCGLNNDYGHPHREVIQEMQDEGIDFYRTDLYGTVTVTAQADGSFTVQTAKQPDEELAPAA